MSNKQDIYLAVLEKEKIFKDLDTIKSPELEHVISALRFNIDSLGSSMMLPMTIAYNAIEKKDWYERLRRALSTVENNENTKAIESKMEEMYLNDTIDYVYDILDELVEDEGTGFKRGITTSFNSLIVYLWTIIETLTTDTWISIVNSNPDTLGKAAFQCRKDIITKSIGQSLLEASFDINFRNLIGTISAKEYDFSNPKGIIKAYSVILVSEKEQIKSILNNKIIREVQSFRNVIVHNSGIIDDACCKMIKDNSKLGTNIEISGKELLNYVENVLNICIDFLNVIDKTLKK